MLAELACKHIAGRQYPHLLVAGLGMGFTLATALSYSVPNARVTVSELMPAVVRWNRNYLGPVAGFPLDDERVFVVEQDVGKVMREDNDALYSLRGLNNAYDALRPGGVLTVWSVASDTAFTQRLMKVGFEITQQRVRAHSAQRSLRHTIWIGIRQPS